jgi:hypothetical protein
MAVEYVDLSDAVRGFMVAEVHHDGEPYAGTYFSAAGIIAWKDLLLTACQNGDDVSLAAALRANPYLAEYHDRKGKPAKVPVNAPEVLAESNYGRFYLRGLCLQAANIGVDHLIGYRAKAVQNPRPGSDDLIGVQFHAPSLLDDLRATMDGSPALGMPPGVGSGILARLP